MVIVVLKPEIFQLYIKVYTMEKDCSRFYIEHRISKGFLVILCLLFILAGLPGTSISADEAAGKEVKQQNNPYAKAEITIKTIPSANNTFGYDILVYGKPLVHQPTIPGLPGNEGFTTKERAQKVAEFVVKKIRNNDMPPTVAIEDLNNMGVLK
jgi:hypothetical protein